METNELKKIWQTLSDEKLIDKSLAKEHIERIIKLKSSMIVDKLSKKLRFDYRLNVMTSLLIIAITIFATLYLNQLNQHLPLQGYLFLVLVFSFYTLKAVSLRSKMKLLGFNYNSSSVLHSLKMDKEKFEKGSKRESVIIYISITILTIYANFLINDKTNFSNFNLNSLQGYVLVFSICYLIALPWGYKYYFNKRFSAIITDLNQSIGELSSGD